MAIACRQPHVEVYLGSNAAARRLRASPGVLLGGSTALHALHGPARSRAGPRQVPLGWKPVKGVARVQAARDRNFHGSVAGGHHARPHQLRPAGQDAVPHLQGRPLPDHLLARGAGQDVVLPTPVPARQRGVDVRRPAGAPAGNHFHLHRRPSWWISPAAKRACLCVHIQAPSFSHVWPQLRQRSAAPAVPSPAIARIPRRCSRGWAEPGETARSSRAFPRASCKFGMFHAPPCSASSGQ